MISKLKMWAPTLSLSFFISLFLILSALAIPVSSTAKSVFLGLSLASILISSENRNELRALFSNAWCRYSLFLFLVIVVASFWSPANIASKFWVFEKYSKLLYLPILVIGFRDERARRLSIYAFLIAMLVTCLFSIIKFNGLFGYDDVGVGGAFRNHIMTSAMMSFAAYLCGFLIFKEYGYIRIVYIVLFSLFSYQLLFINGGRMGYIAYLLLMSLLAIQNLSKRQAIIGILIICSFFILNYSYNPLIKSRVNAVLVDIKSYQQQAKDSSIGYRLQFHAYAFDLFKRHPFIGNGTASFPHQFDQEKPVPSWQKLLEPHSQYWLMAAEFGLLGELAFMAFLVSLIAASLKLKEMRMIAMAVLIPFIIGNLSDSLLFYSGSGYFFIFFMALCLGEQVQERGLYQDDE